MIQLNELLGNAKLVKLLFFYLDHPQEEQSYTQLLKTTKLSRATLGKHLKFLNQKGILKLREIGLNRLYSLNGNNYLVKQLKILLNLSRLGFFTDLSKKFNLRFYLYGSAARGEDNEESDIDILCLGEVKKEKLMEIINAQSKKLSKEIRLQLFTLLEWSQMKDKDSAFYERVEKDKIEIK